MEHLQKWIFFPACPSIISVIINRVYLPKKRINLNLLPICFLILYLHDTYDRIKYCFKPYLPMLHDTSPQDTLVFDNRISEKFIIYISSSVYWGCSKMLQCRQINTWIFSRILNNWDSLSFCPKVSFEDTLKDQK